MTLERAMCPVCSSKNCYRVKGGDIVCRTCGFDAREEEQIVNTVEVK